MCTAITLKTQDGLHALGRNLDIVALLDVAVILIPRSYAFTHTIMSLKKKNKYAMVGMSTTFENHVLVVDGMNEKGLACAVLELPKYASWSKALDKDKINVAPYDFVYWILANFQSLEEVKDGLKNVNLVNESLEGKEVSVDVHWIVTDRTGQSIVIEKTKGNFRIYNNKVGVLTNAPTFDWHLINLNRYMNIQVTNPHKVKWGHQELSFDSEGFGGIGLPGDVSSSSRFVKAAFLRNHIRVEKGEDALITSTFHILSNVAVIKGTAVTCHQQYLKTQCTSCMCLETGVYYYNTYNNNQINAIHLFDENLDASEVKVFPYQDKLVVQKQN